MARDTFAELGRRRARAEAKRRGHVIARFREGGCWLAVCERCYTWVEVCSDDEWRIGDEGRCEEVRARQDTERATR